MRLWAEKSTSNEKALGTTHGLEYIGDNHRNSPRVCWVNFVVLGCVGWKLY